MTNQNENINNATEDTTIESSVEYRMQWNTNDMPRGSRRKSAKSHHSRHHTGSSHRSHTHSHRRSTSRHSSKSRQCSATAENDLGVSFDDLIYKEQSDLNVETNTSSSENNDIKKGKRWKIISEEKPPVEKSETLSASELDDDSRKHQTESKPQNEARKEQTEPEKTEGQSNTTVFPAVKKQKSISTRKTSETRSRKSVGMRKIKELKTWKKVLLSVLTVLLIVFAGGFAYINGSLNKITRERSDVLPTPDPNAIYSDDSEEDHALAKEKGLTIYEDLDREDQYNVGSFKVTPIHQENVKNILLIGQDRRTGDGGRMRADSIIIATIDLTTNEIELTSLMRDMYLPVPGYGYGMINATYLNGGIALLDATIEQDFGVTIDGNIQLDFTRFIGLMDHVGSIDITLNQEEADYLNNGHNWNLKAGNNAMNSEQILAYCRTRNVGRSDWERTDRQRSVVTKIFLKLRSSGVGTMVQFVNDVFPLLRTDMTNMEIIQYVYTIMSNHMEITESRRIPVEGSYTQEIREETLHVLIPNLYTNAQALQKYIYGYTNVWIEENRKQVENQNRKEESSNTSSTAKKTSKKEKTKKSSMLVIDE